MAIFFANKTLDSGLVLHVTPLWCMLLCANHNPKTNPSIHHNVQWGYMKYLLSPVMGLEVSSIILRFLFSFLRFILRFLHTGKAPPFHYGALSETAWSFSRFRRRYSPIIRQIPLYFFGCVFDVPESRRCPKKKRGFRVGCLRSTLA